MRNNELLRKADLAISDLTNDGGYLNPTQSDAFIRMLIAQPTLLRDSRVVRMPAPQFEINKIGFGSRILRPAISGTALDDADRVKPTTGKVTLVSKEVMATVYLPYDVIEDNIERASISDTVPAGPESMGKEGIKGTIVSMMAERAALDLEELALNGDTASGDAYLALTDGYLKLATSHIVDVNGAGIDKTMFKNGVIAMPDQYLRNRAIMNHYISVDNETEYRDTLADRFTALGDTMIQGMNTVYAFGSPIKPVSLMGSTVGLFTNPQNLIFGIQRQIQIETDKDIQKRVYVIVLTIRMDFKIEEVDAIVKYIEI